MNKDRKLNRLRNYDYSQAGYYFITICVQQELRRENIFGKIINGKMELNEYGKILFKQWIWIAERYKHIILDEWVIMPDHFHAIVTIVHPESDNFIVGTGRDLSLRKYKPLSQIIGAFKTTTSKIIHLAGYNDYAWQRSYYDHIIRNNESLSRIRKYIRDNPKKWNAIGTE